MCLGSDSSVVLIGGGCGILLFCHLIAMLVCIVVILVFMSCSVMVSGFVLIVVVYLEFLNVVCFLSLGVCLCIVSLCSGCDECCYFCMICDACRLRCYMSGSSFVSCVHTVAVLNAAFFCNLKIVIVC